jgi:hypothetical protein
MQLLSLTLYNFVCRSETVDDPCYFQSDKMSPYNFFKMGYFLVVLYLLLQNQQTAFRNINIEVWLKRNEESNLITYSSVAAWLSETVLRGRGPGASGFESHRRGRIFSKEGNSAGPWMCVCV